MTSKPSEDEFVEILADIIRVNAAVGDADMDVYPIVCITRVDDVIHTIYADVDGMAKLLARELNMYKICSCWSSPDNAEGTDPACPIHGAVRAYNEAMKETARLHRRLYELERERNELLASNATLKHVLGEGNS